MTKRSLKEQGSSRRSFLAGSAAGLGSAWVAANWTGILEAQEHAKRAATSGSPGKFEFFSPEQATEVESVAAQIIPTDDTPGAREAGAVYFIDRALTTRSRCSRPSKKPRSSRKSARIPSLGSWLTPNTAATGTRSAGS